MKQISIKILLLTSAALVIIGCNVGNSQNHNDDLVSYLTSKATGLSTSSDLDELIDNAGDKQLALLGEASHGTHEYYAWRDSISRRLITEKGFSFIAVEGDWASLYELNRYVKDMEGAAGSAREVLKNLQRWPLWMWGNEEVEGLIEWMREYNKDRSFEDKVGFYGMDVYDEWNSQTALYAFLEKHDSEILEQLRSYYDCFAPYGDDSWEYARAVRMGRDDCTDETAAAVDLILNSRNELNVSDHEFLYAKQNAYVLKYAEKFYRQSVQSQGPESWNSRVEHMFLTVSRLLDYYGDDAKGIVWAHNTHVGDARATDMARRGQVNIGQLSRESLGEEEVFITGFGTFRGTVKAGRQWGQSMQRLNVPDAHPDSYEFLLNQVTYENFMLIIDEQDRQHEEFNRIRGHRAIGVVYNPEREVPGNYVITVLPERYDAFIFFEETRALSPLRR